MVLEYFALKRGGKAKATEAEEGPRSPVLNEQEEKFLERITSEEEPPPLPQRPVVILDGGNTAKGKDAQVALMDSADKIPLPGSPPVETDEQAQKEAENKESKVDEKKSDDGKKKKNYWGFVPMVTNLRTKSNKGKEKQSAADTLASAAQAVKSGGTDAKPDKPVDDEEAKKEEEDLSKVLDQLNLAAVNNRVFSFSKESQELMDKFKLVLKDLINGVPTAYNDLENLLKNSNEQLEKMFNGLPPFLQNLVKSLPAKMSAALAPEVLAASSEKPGADAKFLAAESSKPGLKSKRSKIPSLKKLATQQGAVTAMLRSIMNFLKLRFPAFITGTNVLLSLALFLLLFVFWYCHKRGREVRLEKERQTREAASAEVSDSEFDGSSLEESAVLEKKKEGESSEPPITIHEPASDDTQNARIADLPSVLDLPEPQSAPLPKASTSVEKDPSVKQ